jgi:heptosyltransferase-2
MGAERILVVRIAGIGDVAVASTAVERIRTENPSAHVTFLCGTAAAPLARLFDGVAEVLTVDERALFRGGIAARGAAFGRLWSALVRRRFDRVILLHVDRRYRALVAPLIGARVSMLSRAKHGEMIPVPARWLGDEYARLVAGTAHVGPIERQYAMADLRDKIQPDRARTDRPRVILVPGGARNVLRDDALRRWPVSHYAALARLLAEQGYEITLIGSETDRWVMSSFDGIAVTDEIGKLDLPRSLSVMRGGDLVISHDTGPAHLARLVRVPLIALFGPTIPAQVLSIDESVTVLWGGEHLACRPCFDGREFARCADNVCMSSITPELVLRAAQARLEPRSSATPDRRAPQTPRENATR